MIQIVQATCPHCKNTLRIPTEWLQQALRCKHCQQTFQSRPKAPVAQFAPPVLAGAWPAAPVAAPVPVALGAFAPRPMPAQVPIAAPAPFSGLSAAPPAALDSHTARFDFDDSSAPLIRPPSRRRGNWWKGPLLGLGVVVVATVSLYFAGPMILERVNEEHAEKKAETQVVKVEPKALKKEPPAETKPLKERPPTIITPPLPGFEDNRPRKETPAEKGPRPKDPDKNPKNRPNPDKNPKPGPLAKPLFPRRALLVSVNEYLFANPLHYGMGQKKDFPGSTTKSLMHDLQLRLQIPATQTAELSDLGMPPMPPLKNVIENAITDYLSSSRDQDRVVLLFAGHALEDEKDSFLVPLEGDLKDTKTLIPLTWVYDQLKACKARQKLLILDVCRFEPARGNERPGGDPMGKVLDTQLLTPPDGVQVWSSCILEQRSHEFESGSAFLQALAASMQTIAGIQEPEQSLPLDMLVPKVNMYLDKLLSPQKLKQLSRLTGKEPEAGAPFNATDAPAPQLMVRAPQAPMGDFAGTGVIQKIVEEINRTPQPRSSRPGSQDSLRVTALLPFPAKAVQPFLAEGGEWDKYKDQKAEFPLRAAIVNAAMILQENAQKFNMKEVFRGANTAMVKKAVAKEQTEPAKAIFFLEEALADLQKAGEARDKEMSKRWQAHYDYVMARLKARLIYLMEYNYVLAQIRSDSLPPLEDGASGYRLGSRTKVSVPEGKVKEWVRDLDKSWQRIIREYPETPWALLARRERLTVLGLEWRPSRD